MSTNLTRRKQIVASLRDKNYRDAFVAAEIDTGLAMQIRAMREARGWTQAELGHRVGMAQERISALEDPDYGKYTLTTLKRLASAFDVALLVRFAPFSQLADSAAALSHEDLAVAAFDADAAIYQSTAPSASTATAFSTTTTTGRMSYMQTTSTDRTSTLTRPRVSPPTGTRNVYTALPRQLERVG